MDVLLVRNLPPQPPVTLVGITKQSGLLRKPAAWLNHIEPDHELAYRSQQSRDLLYEIFTGGLGVEAEMKMNGYGQAVQDER